MSVKGIFRTLLVTVILMVAVPIIIELFNIMLYSTRLANMTKLAVSQSAELFAQESYKYEDGARSSNLPAINYSDGVDDAGNNYTGDVYLDGNIYESDIDYEIWYKLYEAEPYVKFSENFKDNWYSLGIMNKALDGVTTPSVMPDWDDYEGQKAYTEASMAEMYRETMYTPLNMGIPYVGEYGDSSYTYNRDTALDRIFQWNLTQLLSNCNPNNIRKDKNGELYVMYNGFRCYTNKASVTSVEYEVFDVTTDDGKARFKELTSIDAERLSFGTSSEDLENLTTMLEEHGVKRDERTNICVAYINYSLPVSYKGITPVARVFEWIWSNETRVDGYKGTAPTYTEQKWNDNTQDLSGGGAGILSDSDSNNDTLPTTGKLVYYIVR